MHIAGAERAQAVDGRVGLSDGEAGAGRGQRPTARWLKSAVDPQHRLLVSPRLRADFSNGDQFYAKAGQVIELPERRADRPGREFLEWHLDEVFLKAAAT